MKVFIWGGGNTHKNHENISEHSQCLKQDLDQRKPQENSKFKGLFKNNN